MSAQSLSTNSKGRARSSQRAAKTNRTPEDGALGQTRPTFDQPFSLSASDEERAPLPSEVLLTKKGVRGNSPQLFPLFIFAFALVVFPAVPGRCAIELPALFGHNMVLQQGGKTVIWGKCSSQSPVLLKYEPKDGDKPKLFAPTTKSDIFGFWRIEFELPAFQEPVPGSLIITEGSRAGAGGIELTNVVPGDVWIVAGTQGKGLPGTRPQRDIFRRERVRFLDITDFSAVNVYSRQVSSWRIYPRTEEEFQSLSILTLHMANGLAPLGFAGLIETTTRGIRPLPLPSQFDSTVSNAWFMASNDVRDAQASRAARLRELKRNDRVEFIPAIFPYEFPSIYLPIAFPGEKPPTSVLAFKAAVWFAN